MQQLTSQIVEVAMLVPGLIALASPSAKVASALSKNDWAQGVLIEPSARGLDISLGIYVNAEVKTVTIVDALASALKALTRQQGALVNKLNIIVRGVR